MSNVFRIRLRLKSIRPYYKPAPDTRPLSELLKGLPRTPLPSIPASVCPRCGIKWDKPMGYCCPEGQMCGVPRETRPTVFIPQVQTVGSDGLIYKQPEGVTYRTWN